MTGLEKITDRILAEARAQAGEIREKAEEEAGAVLRETEKRLSRLREEAKEREALVKKELETRARFLRLSEKAPADSGRQAGYDPGAD